MLLFSQCTCLLNGNFGAYFLPIQFLGPVENGCSDALLSDAYASSTQRSGMNWRGFLKFLGFDDVQPCETCTDAYISFNDRITHEG